ncbi:MAG: hypothetical protein ACTHKF_09180 [Candidatus Nitrosocosmicus sp.]
MFFGSLSGAICNNSIPSGSCSPGVVSLLSSNFGNSKSQTVNNSVCQTASCAIQGGTNGERICDPGPCTDTPSSTISAKCLTGVLLGYTCNGNTKNQDNMNPSNFKSVGQTTIDSQR